MDVNGTKYHLLYGPGDWGGCRLVESDGARLADLWDDDTVAARLTWDDESGSLRLATEVPLFRKAGRRPEPLPLAARRGAGRDRYGNWYWIDAGETGVRFLASGTGQATQFWTSVDRAGRCATPAEAEGFAECQPAVPAPLLLRGLAVTTRHYLVVGDVTERGLLIFDLHGGGAPPLLLRWPDGVDFVPWDLAPTPDGGVLVLDREHRTYWALDATFRLLADVAPDAEAPFQPAGGALPRNVRPGERRPRGYPLASDSPPGPGSPVSIEPGPDGNVLILDTDPGRPYSIVYEYHGATLLAAYTLEDRVTAMDPDPAAGEGVPIAFSVVGHDFAYVAPPAGEQGAGGTPPPELLYVADRAGKQVLAFAIDRARGQLDDRHQFLPLRRWGGKALVAAGGPGGLVYYDFGERWVPVQSYEECHYAGRGTITTPLAFDAPGSPPSPPALPSPLPPRRPFDGEEPGCVWHRLFLDAQIPAGCAVRVRARAHDDPDLLPLTGWTPQPDPYLRSDGAELPYYDPWADAERPLPERTGTWELLFQGAVGRYLQLELTVEGTGRATPALRALRAWYPRFSYLDHYLPAIYREEPAAASFLERWLANFEGFYTNLEDKIEQVAALFDPRTAPATDLDWLACWLGLALDPLWPEDRRRFFIRHAHEIYRLRGTVPGVQIAVRLYLDDRVEESLFDPRCWGGSKVRIVERFLTRGSGGLAFGDPSDGGGGLRRPLTPADVEASAHRFVVLVPHTLREEQRAMVARIVALEKPAHAAFELKRYWDLFRVGEARLGLDTQLGESSRFSPLLLGGAYLADAYLAAPYPFDVADRVVADRDRLGELPPL